MKNIAIDRNGMYLCIKEPPAPMFEDVERVYGYLFEYYAQFPKNGTITMGSLYPNKGLFVYVHPDFFDEYFRDITKMTLIDHVHTNDCDVCPLSYRYHNTEMLDEPEWQFFCSVDGCDVFDDNHKCPAHYIKSQHILDGGAKDD